MVILKKKRAMLKRKKVHPRAYSEPKRRFAGIEYLVQIVNGAQKEGIWAQYKTFAIPPVAIVIVNQVHVKCCIRSLKLILVGNLSSSCPRKSLRVDSSTDRPSVRISLLFSWPSNRSCRGKCRIDLELDAVLRRSALFVCATVRLMVLLLTRVELL